jgi:hypothetical protein
LKSIFPVYALVNILENEYAGKELSKHVVRVRGTEGWRRRVDVDCFRR